MLRFRILGVVLLFFCSVTSIGQTTVDIDGFYRTSNSFAEKYNKCLSILQEKEQNNMSPYSPDYWDEFLSCWVKSGASDEFGKLERQINDISWLLGKKGK